MLMQYIVPADGQDSPASADLTGTETGTPTTGTPATSTPASSTPTTGTPTTGAPTTGTPTTGTPATGTPPANRGSRQGWAVVGGAEYAVGGWGEYEIERRRARWEEMGGREPVALMYPGQEYVTADDVILSVLGSVQTAVGGARTAAENARTAAENARTATENARTATENARTAAENARIGAIGGARTAAKGTRITAQTARMAAKSVWIPSRQNPLQKAALRLAESLSRLEDRTCEPDEAGLWECARPDEKPSILTIPPITSADLRYFAGDPIQQADPDSIYALYEDVAALVAEVSRAPEELPALPPPKTTPPLPSRVVPINDDEAVLRLETATAPRIASIEKMQAALATSLDVAARAIDRKLDRRQG